MVDPTLNFERVQNEIAYAFENVGFFREHMRTAGKKPSNIQSPSDMRHLPPTEKADYRRNFPAGVLASGYSLTSRHVMRFQSSGTEGERLVSVVHSYDLAQRQATCLRFNPRFDGLWRPGLQLRTCRYAAPNCSDVECSNPGSTMQSRLLPDGTLVLPVYHDLLSTPAAMTAQALDETDEYDPHFLFVDPTHFAFLIRAMRKAGRKPHRISDLCINSGYTLCTGVARRQINECYGPDVPFANMLGMSELGYLGFECPCGRLHVNANDYYVEFVADGCPAQAGELAELVITTLGDRLSPHIRYATGDLFRQVAEPCPCGNRAPVVLAEGRAKHVLVLHDGSVMTPRELDESIGTAPWIDVYRMSQTGDDAFVFQLLHNELWTIELERNLAARLQHALKTTNVNVRRVTYIPADRGGKFISCMSSVAASRGSWNGHGRA